MLRALPKLLLPIVGRFGSSRAVPAMGFKSQLSIDKLYPNSNADFLRSPFATSYKPSQTDPDKFDGVIPIDSLDIRYSRSGGPGGQHVNKVNSKVEIRVHVASAEWIPIKAKDKLIEAEKNRITKDGYLILTSEKTRKQILNQADCLDKLRSIIRTACKEEHVPSAEELELASKRKDKAKQSVLRSKRWNSLKKQQRAI